MRLKHAYKKIRNPTTKNERKEWFLMLRTSPIKHLEISSMKKNRPLFRILTFDVKLGNRKWHLWQNPEGFRPKTRTQGKSNKTRG